MFKNFKGFAILLIIAALLTGSLTGCLAPRSRKPLPPSQTAPSRNTPVPGPSKQTTPNPVQQSRNAAMQAKKVGGVTNAVAVGTGSTAIVGISLKGKPSAGTIDGIKRDVANRVKSNDKNIKSVLVTADPNLIKEIRTIFSGIQNGRPISAFTSQITDLTRRIGPTIR